MRARGAVRVRSGGHYDGNEVRHYDWAVRNLILGESCAAIARETHGTNGKDASERNVQSQVRKVAQALHMTPQR